MKRRAAFYLAGVFLLLIPWQIAAMVTKSVALASPMDTLYALIALLSSGPAWKDFALSLYRMTLSLVVGLFLGVGAGVVAGFFQGVRLLLEPARWALMSIPPITILVIVMLWFSTGSLMVVVMTSAMILPIVYINTREGIQYIDRVYMELAAVYRFPAKMVFTEIYLPAIAAPLSAALIQGIGTSVRVVILAEVVGANEGVGAAIFTASSNLDTPTLFAWVLICVLLMAAVETILIMPMRRHTRRWRR